MRPRRVWSPTPDQRAAAATLRRSAIHLRASSCARLKGNTSNVTANISRADGPDGVGRRRPLAAGAAPTASLRVLVRGRPARFLRGFSWPSGLAAPSPGGAPPFFFGAVLRRPRSAGGRSVPPAGLGCVPGRFPPARWTWLEDGKRQSFEYEEAVVRDRRADAASRGEGGPGPLRWRGSAGGGGPQHWGRQASSAAPRGATRGGGRFVGGAPLATPADEPVAGAPGPGVASARRESGMGAVPLPLVPGAPCGDRPRGRAAERAHWFITPRAPNPCPSRGGNRERAARIPGGQRTIS